eukprot:comp7954_c0_seq1/m.3497 comp7954_c0_seq1/g.3497  ORF comp7954_c0_seq1/g.3497 comp7954_c0_seq1/m.3497 type:complete len:110 (-) comp7954_c0_seq1:419-748(-)
MHFAKMSKSAALSLYAQILRLHRNMPQELRYLGDRYVRDEFKRHKNAKPEFVAQFMQQWQWYAKDLSQQLAMQSDNIGAPLAPDHVEALNPEQLGQLSVLREEATKPKE